MAKIPLIPAAQQTFPQFKRRGKSHAIESEEHTEPKSHTDKRSLKQRLSDRRKLNIKVKLNRRYNKERRHLYLDELPGHCKKRAFIKGRYINTTA